MRFCVTGLEVKGMNDSLDGFKTKTNIILFPNSARAWLPEPGIYSLSLYTLFSGSTLLALLGGFEKLNYCTLLYFWDNLLFMT